MACDIPIKLCKRVADSRLFEVDFTDFEEYTEDDQTLVFAVITPPAAAALTVGAVACSGGRVQFRLGAGGVAGAYELTATATWSSGDVTEAVVALDVE